MINLKKKQIISLGIVFSLGIFFSIVINFINYKNYVKRVNEYVYTMVELIKEKNLNITDDEIITILNGQVKKVNYQILKKYGLNKEVSALQDLKKDYHLSVVLTTILILSLSILVFLILINDYLKQKKKIEELTLYLRAINEHNYYLNILENKEGEFAILQDEIYKTTLMLREESDNLLQDKINLKDTLADISHQLKTPLTSILIMLDNILDNPQMDQDTRAEFLKNIRQETENINFLIQVLLKLSRIDANVIEFKEEEINVSALIKKVEENVKVLLKEKQLILDLDIDSNLTFKGDFAWQTEALTNILKNAIEYSKENDHILIKVLDNPLYLKIIIEDFGKGIKKEDLKNIFKRFYKGENSNPGSFGIGLNLAKKIIEKNNGFIKVDSVVNKGTIFEIKYLK